MKLEINQVYHIAFPCVMVGTDESVVIFNTPKTGMCIKKGNDDSSMPVGYYGEWFIGRFKPIDGNKLELVFK